MTDWNEGYVTDVDYTYGFFKEMAPASIRYALLASGHEPPPIDRFSYCELGYGQGAGLALLAAANPQGDFWGTDFNPSHAAGATRLAQDAGLSNLHVFDDSFEQFGRRDLPAFDYIALHGIWSWVSEEVAAQIVDFIGKHLKVGGVVYISYNTLPGWTHALPLRGLLSQYAHYQAAHSEPQAKRIDGAIALLNALNEVPGSYFRSTPQLADRIQALQSLNRNYLAHEYLNRAWRPVFFSQMVDALDRAKLSFAAHANPLHCIDAVNHTRELQKVLDGIEHPVFKEVVRDIGLNQSFRRDLFVRGPRKLSRPDHAAAIAETRYALTTPRAQCLMKIKTQIGEATLHPEVYAPLLDHLAAAGSATGHELMALPGASAAGGPARVLQALVVLVGAGYAQPCVSEALRQAAEPGVARFNQAVVKRTARGGDMDFNFLAASGLGSGVVVPRLPQLFLQAARQRPKADAQALIQLVWQSLRSTGQGLIKDGQPIQGEEASLQELAERLREWQSGPGPLVESLGVRL